MPKRAEELSALKVKELREPGTHFVGSVPGLALQISPSGARSWILRYSIPGETLPTGKKAKSRRRELGLGSFEGVTLAGAREAARKAREQLREGIDPIADRRAKRSALIAAQQRSKTFAECAQAFLDTHGDSWRNAKHRQQWANTLRDYAYPTLGRRLVADIEKSDVLAVLDDLWKRRPETASRLRGRIEKVLSYAIQMGYRPEGPNPARWKDNLDLALGAIPREVHHKALRYGDIGNFMPKLRKAEGMGARALEFTILTAARSGEVRGATWSEIDLDAATWTIPGARMKAGKEHRVPLSDSAVALLKSLPRIEGTDLVFTGSKGKPLSDMTLSAVMRRMGVDAVPHGFRSSFRDWASETTAHPSDVVEAALAHTVANKVEAAYRRGDLFEKRRRLMSDWAAYCALPTAKAGTVHPIRGAA
jgi:integrase